MTNISRTNSNNPDFLLLVRELDGDLQSWYQERQAIYDQFNKVPNLNTVVVLYHNTTPVGCGCFKAFDEITAEIKRMFVTPLRRGTGIATFILTELENWAKELGYSRTVLETGTKQHEAIRFYQREGYVITENYGQYIGMETSICMKKQLA
jgi:GNAT superfamily N-acetyltransferase